jgi:hypothetical protein
MDRTAFAEVMRPLKRSERGRVQTHFGMTPTAGISTEIKHIFEVDFKGNAR